MVDSATHYRNLLAQHYCWMLGTSFDAAVSEQRKLLSKLGIGSGTHGLAVDLGCGPGHHATALADLGFAKVLALDTSQALLDELVAHKGGRPIEPICDDVLKLSDYVTDNSADVAVCMGDTLPHLNTMGEVRILFQACWRALRSTGRLVLTFRDYSRALHGLDRIIPVRSDADRIMTCILDYTADHVEVTDIVYTRADAGWDMQKSSYRKLRLIPDDVTALLRSLRFAVQPLAQTGRMTTIVAVKP